MSLEIRLLEPSDYYNGFLELINEFTRDPVESSYGAFVRIFDKQQRAGLDFTYVCVLDNVIVGTAKIHYEYKYHNHFSLMAHIEDVVVKSNFRHQSIASMLLERMMKDIENSVHFPRPYKIVLSCHENLVGLYAKAGFVTKGISMTKYL